MFGQSFFFFVRCAWKGTWYLTHTLTHTHTHILLFVSKQQYRCPAPNRGTTSVPILFFFSIFYSCQLQVFFFRGQDSKFSTIGIESHSKTWHFNIKLMSTLTVHITHFFLVGHSSLVSHTALNSIRTISNQQVQSPVFTRPPASLGSFVPSLLSSNPETSPIGWRCHTKTPLPPSCWLCPPRTPIPRLTRQQQVSPHS